MRPAPVIVVIDDDYSLTALYRMILEHEGYKVHTATDTEQGMELLCELTPDLILIDCLMPGISGSDFLNALKRRRPELFQKCRIVGLSGLHAQSSLLLELKEVAHAVAEKPDGIDGVVKLVRDNLLKLPERNISATN